MCKGFTAKGSLLRSASAPPWRRPLLSLTAYKRAQYQLNSSFRQGWGKRKTMGHFARNLDVEIQNKA